jgi:hypothetical protein
MITIIEIKGYFLIEFPRYDGANLHEIVNQEVEECLRAPERQSRVGQLTCTSTNPTDLKVNDHISLSCF